MSLKPSAADLSLLRLSSARQLLTPDATVEDVGVKPYQVDRMLVQLRDAGYLHQLQGVVLGDFSGCVQHPDQGYTMDEVFADFFSEIPVTTGWPVGHADAPHFTIPLGLPSRLAVAAEGAARLEIAGIAD